MDSLDSYSVYDVACTFKEYISNLISDEEEKFGFIICGYNKNNGDNDFPEVYEIQYSDDELKDPKCVNPNQPIFISLVWRRTIYL